MEVWENKKLLFPRYFEFSQTLTSVPVTYGSTEKNVFYFFYKITRIENYNVEIAFFIKA